MLSRAKSRRRLSLAQTLIVLSVFILTGNLIAGIGVSILFDGHADQAQPRLPYRPADAADERPKIRPLAQPAHTADDCVPAPPRYHEISNQARRLERERHLLVHEGDRKQMAQAIAESVRQRRGYATTSAPAMSTQATVYLLASPEWDQTDFDPLQPYGQQPEVRLDSVSADYPQWVRQIYDRQMPDTAPCPETLRPTLVVIHEKPEGQWHDTPTAAAGWLIIGIGLLVMVAGIYLVTN